MELHGTLAYNLQLALESSRRLRGHPVHRDTRASRVAGDPADDTDVDRLIAELETAIAETKADSNS